MMKHFTQKSSGRIMLSGAAIAAALLLSSCGTSGSDNAAPSAPSESSEAAITAVSMNAQWAKASEAGGMTGIFGTLQNTTNSDLIIEKVESPSAGMIELHEVTSEGVMQKIPGDVVIPAGGSYELAPGANHIMLMDLTDALLPGDDVDFTLHFSDGSSVKFSAPVKDYAGANEDYGDLHQGHGTDESADHASEETTEHDGH